MLELIYFKKIEIRVFILQNQLYLGCVEWKNHKKIKLLFEHLFYFQ